MGKGVLSERRAGGWVGGVRRYSFRFERIVAPGAV